jgi:hypothetical protein
MIVFEFVFGFTLGFIIIFLLVRYYHYQLNKQLDSEIQELKSKVKAMKEKIVPLHIRMQDNILYAYNADTNAFVAQGSDLDMLRVNFTSLYPEKKGLVVSSDENCSMMIKEYAERQGQKLSTQKGEGWDD